MVETKPLIQPSLIPSGRPRLIAIGTANPSEKYTQAEILKIFGITDPKISKIFSNSHIKSRHLCLPKPNQEGKMPDESQEDLLQKPKQIALDLGRSAIKKALAKAQLTPQDIDYISVVSTTGLLCPSLSALYIREMGMRQDIQRIDIVGMGCNGGLNGLQPVVNFCSLYPDSIGLLLCVEVCSAMYVIDDTLTTAVVNSLFGDGAAAAIVSAKSFPTPFLPLLSTGPKILGFSSHIIPEAIDGYCTRFHFQLALACDYRVATARSFFQAPEVKEGYLPGMGIFRLAKYTGIGVARRLLFTGAQCSVTEALRLGIVDRACETETLARAIEETQQAFMPIHPEVLQNARRLLNESFSTNYEDAIGHFLAAQNLCLSQFSEKS